LLSKISKSQGKVMKKLITTLISVIIVATACSNQAEKKAIRIGFSMATLKEERWQRDKQAFDAYCKEIGADCRITVANNDAGRQANDVENLLTQGIDVLVIAPHDAVQAATLVEKAKAQGVPVISYDRLIHSDKIDLYISHQVPVIGRKMAEYALQKVPKGNYVMVYGGFTDNNAHIIKKEQMNVLQSAIERNDIRIVAEQFINDWKKEEAQKFAENALTQNNDNVDVFLVSNDGMAGGVIQALERRKLTGKVLVTGQDAEIAALQAIAEGKQTMTIYKPIVPLARGAINAAIKLAKKEPLTDAKPFYNDVIKKEVPAILLDVFVVDKDNLIDTVIKDGYADYDRVFANVPSEKRPPKPL
jgi:D-xylose transport system substrate-binding protein